MKFSHQEEDALVSKDSTNMTVLIALNAPADHIGKTDAYVNGVCN